MFKKILLLNVLAISSLSYGMEKVKETLYKRKELSCPQLTTLLYKAAKKQGKAATIDDKALWRFNAISIIVLMNIKCHQDSNIYGRMDIYDNLVDKFED